MTIVLHTLQLLNLNIFSRKLPEPKFISPEKGGSAFSLYILDLASVYFISSRW